MTPDFSRHQPDVRPPFPWRRWILVGVIVAAVLVAAAAWIASGLGPCPSQLNDVVECRD